MKSERVNGHDARTAQSFLTLMRDNFPRWCAINLCWVLIVSAVTYVYSVTTTITRYIYLFLLGWMLLTAGAYLLRLARQQRRFRIILLAGVLLMIGWMFLAGRAPNTAH